MGSLPWSTFWVLVALVLLLTPAPASAASIVVTSTLPSPGLPGDCTLGEAILAANTDRPVDGCAAGSGADVITLPAGAYLFDRFHNWTDGPNAARFPTPPAARSP